jgi:acyl carrier protein
MRERYGISFAEGVDAFSRILSTKLPQVVVSTQNLQTVINQFKSFGTPISSEESEQSKPKHIRPILGTAYIAPSSELEKKIADSWQELLGIEQVGINDNFLDLGGHSLLATQLVSQLRKDFQVELSVHHIFEAPTIAELALVIEDMILGELEELTEEEAKELVSVVSNQEQ